MPFTQVQTNPYSGMHDLVSTTVKAVTDTNHRLLKVIEERLFVPTMQPELSIPNPAIASTIEKCHQDLLKERDERIEELESELSRVSRDLEKKREELSESEAAAGVAADASGARIAKLESLLQHANEQLKAEVKDRTELRRQNEALQQEADAQKKVTSARVTAVEARLGKALAQAEALKKQCDEAVAKREEAAQSAHEVADSDRQRKIDSVLSAWTKLEKEWPDGDDEKQDVAFRRLGIAINALGAVS